MTITPAELIAIEMRLGRNKRRVEPLPDDSVEDESALHRDIVAFCRSRKWGFIHSAMHRRSTVGIGSPDFVILADRGRTFYIECKAKNGKLKPAQMAFKVQAEFNGHVVHVITAMSEFAAICQKP